MERLICMSNNCHGRSSGHFYLCPSKHKGSVLVFRTSAAQILDVLMSQYQLPEKHQPFWLLRAGEPVDAYYLQWLRCYTLLHLCHSYNIDRISTPPFAEIMSLRLERLSNTSCGWSTHAVQPFSNTPLRYAFWQSFQT